MVSTSRRAFLTGRRAAPASPWENFLSRLRTMAQGSVQDLQASAGAARLVPGHMQDVYHARALCLEFGVCLALDGVPHASRYQDRPVLWVEPASAMARCDRLGPNDSRWFVQPGCLVGDLEQAGLVQFRDQAPQLTVAAWLADRSLCDWDRGATAASGLTHAMVLLDDGTQANLGEFGVANQKPLENRRVQEMVSSLFQLANQSPEPEAEHGRFYDQRYRLDALKPDGAQAPNLAHLLLGHGGELGWVEWLVFDSQGAQAGARPYQERYGQRAGTAASQYPQDQAVRALFAPQGIFPSQAQVL